MAVTLSRAKSDQQQHLHLQKIREKEDHNQLQQNHSHFNNKPHKRVVVPVVYYLSRNGHLEHPHFMEVPLSSPEGLFLRDVILRLNLLRGKSMASHYSWSSKRSYKNGFVWHDLSEDDFIHPVHGGEYVLKGSEIALDTLVSSSSIVNSKSTETTSSSSTTTGDSVSEIPRNRHHHRRRNQSWGAVDLHEYKVYKSESTHDFAGKAAADASTQTDEKRRRKHTVIVEEEDDKEKEQHNHHHHQQQQSTELSREEISPPPSDSSPETLESLMKADGRLITLHGDHTNPTVGSCPSGRMKASSVLMSLISCGSLSFRDYGVAAVKDHGFSMVSNYKSKVTRGGDQTVEAGNNNSTSNNNEVMSEIESSVSSSFAKMALEDKEYFSGSLIETKNKHQELPAILKRSSSYNADSSLKNRSLHLKVEEKEVEGVRAKCIPRKLKTQTSTNKKDSDAETTRVSTNSTQERSQD